MKWDGLLIQSHDDVYKPSDDTFLLATVVGDTVHSGETFVEIGCGTGVSAMVAARAGAKVVAVDRNPHAVRICKENATANGLKLDAVLGDLLSPVVGADVIAFNPPYLPTAPDEVLDGPLNLAFDGGLDGNQTVLLFAMHLAQCTVNPHVILVIHSSLSDPAPLDRALDAQGYRCAIAASEKHPFEVLTVRKYERA